MQYQSLPEYTEQNASFRNCMDKFLKRKIIYFRKESLLFSKNFQRFDINRFEDFELLKLFLKKIVN